MQWTAFSASSAQALVWNVEAGQKLFTIEGHKFDIDGPIFTRDDRFLADRQRGHYNQVLEIKTGQLARTITISK